MQQCTQASGPSIGSAQLTRAATLTVRRAWTALYTRLGLVVESVGLNSLISSNSPVSATIFEYCGAYRWYISLLQLHDRVAAGLHVCSRRESNPAN